MKEEKQMGANNQNVRLQVNFKLNNGDLINVYADDQTELEKGLVTIQDLASLISSVSQSLAGVSMLKAITPSAPASSAAPVATPSGAAPQCKHGEMVFKSGVGDRGPWKGYMCPAPKGALDKCKAIYS